MPLAPPDSPGTLDHTGWGWERLDTSRAWSFQLGTSARWLGPSSALLAFNDRGCAPDAGVDDFCAVVFDLRLRKRVRVSMRRAGDATLLQVQTYHPA